MNYGLKLEEIKQEDFVFGGAQLGDAPINPSADWTGWLPDIEVQNLNGIEPYACVSFATLNVIETLERFEYGATANYSDRFLASASGTAALKGNSPQTVAEILRKKGCTLDKDFPFDLTIDTFDKFYAPLTPNLYTLALGLTAEYEIGHEYVPTNPTSLMNALKYSALVFTTYGWVQDAKGLYYRPDGAQDNHAVMCFGFKENEYWLVFDSYRDSQQSTIKKIRWDCVPMQAKRFTLHRQIVSQSWFEIFYYWLRKSLGR